MESLQADVVPREPADLATEVALDAPQLQSPFAPREFLTPPDRSLQVESLGGVLSPFTESAGTFDESSAESELGQLLLDELEDEEFTEALEAVAQEAAGRFARSSVGWDQELGAPVVDSSDVEQWLESLGGRADGLLAQLEERFAERAVESVTEAELDEAMRGSDPAPRRLEDPLAAEELFWGGLKKKVKRVAAAAKRAVKKGVRLASRFTPLGLLLGRLRPILSRLMKEFLRRVVGRLPRHLRGPAKALAQKYGVGEAETVGEGEFTHLAAEFDLLTSEAILEPGASRHGLLETELAAQEQREDRGTDPVAQLDVARERLTQQILDAEAGDSLAGSMEQFIPAVMAALPLVRTTIRLVGRKRVVGVVARLIAQLIAPMVGRKLAGPLSTQIADKGLALLKLEAEAEAPDGRWGAEAMVATAEEAIVSALTLPEQWLGQELLMEVAIQEAFDAAALRHFPRSVLRSEIAETEWEDEREDERGVWLMMPRSTSPVYRYKKYSRVAPVRISRPMARGVVFVDGETLEERLLDHGVTSWPVEAEVHAYETLPGADKSHVAAFELEAGGGTDPGFAAAQEYDELEEAGALPLPADMTRSAKTSRPGARKLVRIEVAGRGVRRRSPVALRLDLGSARPVLRMHLWVSEQRAHALVAQLARRQHREVLSVFRRLTGDGVRRSAGRRLRAMLARRGVVRDSGTTEALAAGICDAIVAALGNQLPALAPTLASAAKDQASGLTVTASFTFGTKDDIRADAIRPPTLSVRPGRHRG